MNQTEIINEIEQCFLSQEAYAKAKKYKDQFKEQQSTMAPIICEAIRSTMTEGTPMSKLLALRLCKELMDHKSEAFARSVSDKLLSKMKQIAQFRKNDSSDTRGKFLFSDNPTKELGSIGNSLMKLCLDCIKVWAIWFPFSDYKVAYDELMNEGVQFPAKYTYFKEFNDNPQSLGQSLILSSNSSKEQPPIKQSVIKTTKIDAKQLQLLLRQELEFVGDIFKGNENDESINQIRQVMNNFEQFKPQLESSLMQILDSGDDALINDLVLKQDIIETLLNEYSIYLNKKINWTQLVKKYYQLCPQQNSTPQPMSSIIQPPKQKNDQILSVIREEDTNNDIDKSQNLQSKIISDQQRNQNNKIMVQSQQQQIQPKSKQIYKALSLNLDDEESQKTQDQTAKQTDYTNTKQSKGQNHIEIQPAKFTNTLLESNPLQSYKYQGESQKKEESKIMSPKNGRQKELEPPEDEIIVEESKPQSQINNSNQKQLLRSNLEKQLEQSEKLKILSSQDLIISQQQQQTQKLVSQFEQAIQDSTVKIDHIDTPVNKIQESRINQNSKKINRTLVDPFLTLEIPSEMPQQFEQQQSMSLSQVSKHRNNSVQPSRNHSAKRETYALDKFEIDILREENKQLKQDLVNLRDQYEKKQKQHTQEIEDKINEITKLNKLINELDFSKSDNKQQIIQRFQETEHLSIELSTLQYKHKQLQQQHDQQIIQLENQSKEMALKSKQIQMQNVEICKLKSQLAQDVENKRRSESVGQYSKTVQQFYPCQRIQKDIDYDIPQLTESQKNLIYPFTNPYEYYRDRLKNNQKGSVIQQTSEWQRVNIDPNNKALLKSAIIQQQSMLYTNKQLEIGCKLEKLNDQTLILHLYFMNANKLSSYKIDCQFSLANEVLTRAQKRKSFQLYQDSSEDISIEYSISRIPLGLSSMNVTITSAKNVNQSVYLPITIFPFIKFLNLTLKEYRSYWKMAKMHLIRSDPFQYNKEGLKEIFYKHFSVIELNSHKKREFLAGIDEIKYGSIIQCRNSNYLVRYILQPNNLMVIQMACLQGRQNHSEYILNNFVFIFSY